MKTILFIIVFVLCIPALCPADENIITINNGLVIVQFEKPLQKVAETVIRMYPEIRLEIEQMFQSDIDFNPTIRLMRDRDTFQNMVHTGPVVAVAISEDNLIIIDNSKMKTHPFSLETTLKHELCHLFLHQYVGNGELPRWLNEGICQNISDGIAEIMIGENKNLMKQAVLTGRLIPMNSLNRGFPSQDRQLLLAYEQSKSFVEYMENRYSPEGTIHILDYLRQGKDIATSVQMALSVPFSDLEKNWQIHLKRKITWLTYVSSHIYQILFLMAALAMVYGFIRFWIRKRNYKDEDDEFIPE
ncbi:MAG: hypothetical protein JSW20_10115 [Nitrospiraceae bacterium]|nr:MAG: hypothetical protein JSW20_10115 [Nitrospiraceae bacterium]